MNPQALELLAREDARLDREVRRKSLSPDKEIASSLVEIARTLEVEDERIHMLHARAFSGALVAMIDSGDVTEDYRTHLSSLRACLTKLGWCP